MRNKSIALLPLLACLPCLASAQSVVGEWNLDAPACANARVTYTEDGRHESLQRGEDGWQTLASGTWTQQGDRITVAFEGQQQILEVVEVDQRRLVLRNPDPEQMQELGMEQVEFVRCPAR